MQGYFGIRIIRIFIDPKSPWYWSVLKICKLSYNVIIEANVDLNAAGG